MTDMERGVDGEETSYSVFFHVKPWFCLSAYLHIVSSMITDQLMLKPAHTFLGSYYRAPTIISCLGWGFLWPIFSRDCIANGGLLVNFHLLVASRKHVPTYNI